VARVGIFGGTFDPPHLGHLVAASDALRALRLERVLFVASAIPPHKRERVRTPAATRLEMVGAAIAGDPRFAADGLELRREGPSYTADTLRELHRRAPADELFLLLGADAVRDLPTWHQPAEVARLAALAAMTRAGEGTDPALPYPAMPVPVTRVDISATEIRRRVAAGESIRYLVPEAVRAIIERDGLYRDAER
jgi:nicotinate-nucleotide adenylyltransferase